ncbi:hypothetical protein F8388_022837 [Cannabis sativa]|uniref:Uncharacterized protein n=1 Tax=Cannabis sativa TaxID=3483 RepID=A0A7J6FC06_CANSA|nr:hypothetical protein F8388_022837 [Cannabis sativa]
MWGFASNAISSIGPKKSSKFSSQAFLECSDDDVCSNSSREEGLDVPYAGNLSTLLRMYPMLIYKGNLKFPRKNFFLLWMVESLNGDRVKFGLSFPGENQHVLPHDGSEAPGNPTRNGNLMSVSFSSCSGLSRYNGDNGRSHVDGNYFSLHKSIDFFIHFTSKFPLVIILLLIVDKHLVIY